MSLCGCEETTTDCAGTACTYKFWGIELSCDMDRGALCSSSDVQLKANCNGCDELNINPCSLFSKGYFVSSDKSVTITPVSLDVVTDAQGQAILDQYGKPIYKSCYLDIKNGQEYNLNGYRILYPGNTSTTSHILNLLLEVEGIDLTFKADPAHTGYFIPKLSNASSSAAKNYSFGCTNTSDRTIVANPAGSLYWNFDCNIFKLTYSNTNTNITTKDTVTFELQKQPAGTIGRSANDASALTIDKPIHPESDWHIYTTNKLGRTDESGHEKLDVFPGKFCPTGYFPNITAFTDKENYCGAWTLIEGYLRTQNQIIGGGASPINVNLQTATASGTYSGGWDIISVTVPLTIPTAVGVKELNGVPAPAAIGGFGMMAQISFHCNFVTTGGIVNGGVGVPGIALSMAPMVNGLAADITGQDVQVIDHAGQMPTTYVRGDLSTTGIFSINPGATNTITMEVAVHVHDRGVAGMTYPTITLGEMHYTGHILLYSLS